MAVEAVIATRTYAIHLVIIAVPSIYHNPGHPGNRGAENAENVRHRQGL